MPFSDELIYEQLTKINTNLQRVITLLDNHNLAQPQQQTTLDASQYVDTKQAAKITGLTKAFFEKARWIGNGPPYSKLGRVIQYKVRDLLLWCDTNKYNPVEL